MQTAKRDIPGKIICLTEESVETLALLGRLDLVAGVSIFVKRPLEAQNLPKVSAFTNSKIETIVDMKPDLILGFSDIQKDIARDLIGAGMNVWIANHRTLQETLDYVLMLGRLVGEEARAQVLVDGWQHKLEFIRQKTSSWSYRPKVYFEEWDEPQISAIRWVSELITAAGGEDIFAERSSAKLAQGRFCSADEVVKLKPDIIFGCWCGKRVKLDSFATRPGWGGIPAIKNKQVYELEPEIFLQPGPALFVDGLDLMVSHLEKL
jgi:iron complex transport system substrate-binding protein